MIDLHCHLLPGIDDGPPDMQATLALAAAAVQAGTRTIVATPHVSHAHPNRAEAIGALIAEVGDALREDGLALEVRSGAEVTLTRALELGDGELGALHLGGGPWLLLECPLSASAGPVEAILGDIQARGHRIVLAHPERSPVFQHDHVMLERLVHMGMLTSVTASAFGGRFGREVQRFAWWMYEHKLVHNVASDAHDDRRRPPMVLAELQRVGLAGAASWLTQDVPAAVLAGESIPPPPPMQQRPRRGLLARLGL
jgi:protein-tyrosine phosphatase